jgi:SHS2 domain-containing protein
MSEDSLSRSTGDNCHKGFEEVEHTADRALHVCGRNLEEVLQNAARGMNSLMVSDVAAISSQVEKYIEAEALDAESLLVEWLSELAYWAETEGLVFNQFDFQEVTPTRVQAVVRGCRARNLDKDIKAVTYHNLQIVKTGRGLEATIVFDV